MRVLFAHAPPVAQIQISDIKGYSRVDATELIIGISGHRGKWMLTVRVRNQIMELIDV
jgi:hypothetical protein